MNLQDIQIQAVMLYGSVARGDSDRISDCDVLLVDEDPRVLHKVSLMLERYKYSCASYTWSRLARMVLHGALFLQHLKEEGVLVKDDGGKLANLLKAYEPRADYSDDIEATKEVIALTAHTHSSKVSIGWASDILAVAVRNMGVLHLANSMQYHFSFRTVLDELAKCGKINSDDHRLLAQLRFFKNLYRQRRFQDLPGMNAFRQIRECAFRCFEVDCRIQSLHSDVMIDRFMSDASAHPNRYCRFRLLERALVTCLYEMCVPQDQLSREAMVIIRSQNQYGLFYQDLSVPLAKRVRQIVAVSNDLRQANGRQSNCLDEHQDLELSPACHL